MEEEAYFESVCLSVCEREVERERDIERERASERASEREKEMEEDAEWGAQCTPPWRQPRGKWMVSLVNSHMTYNCHQNRVASVGD